VLLEIVAFEVYPDVTLAAAAVGNVIDATDCEALDA
jgi:hypothetical protein